MPWWYCLLVSELVIEMHSSTPMRSGGDVDRQPILQSLAA
jgi:hypothetical protein